MLLDAPDAGSDLHFEPYETTTAFPHRRRIAEIASPPIATGQLASRIKVIWRMDISKAVLQDGKMKLKIGPTE
jgi:type II secretory ATPase GspE/PulE/Tfp pilus assembly ATPase PilB-like protein